MILSVRWSVLAACLAGWAGTGCSSIPKIYLRGVEPLNVNSRGESTAVTVRIYGLRDPQAFSNATLDQLWVNNDAVKQAMIDSDPILRTVLPGSQGGPTEEVVLENLGKGTYVGIMALFGKEHEAGGLWRLVLPTEQANGTVFELREYKIVKSAN